MRHYTHYTRLGLSNNEAMFVLQLMCFKWNENAAFPSYKTLAQRMGVTPEMARRHAKNLETKRLLVRMKRKRQNNAFDPRSMRRASPLRGPETLLCKTLKLKKVKRL